MGFPKLKLDAAFPANQFFIQGYSTVYRLDRNNKVGRIMLFLRDEIITFPLDQYLSQWALKHFA